MTDVKALIKKRGTIEASVSRINTFTDNFDPELNDHHALKIKLHHLMELSAKYDEIQTQIAVSYTHLDVSKRRPFK